MCSKRSYLLRKIKCVPQISPVFNYLYTSRDRSLSVRCHCPFLLKFHFLVLIPQQFWHIFQGGFRKIGQNCILCRKKFPLFLGLLVQESVKGNSSLPASLNKKARIFATVFIIACHTCQEHIWGGEKVVCSQNGIKNGKNGLGHWSWQKSLFFMKSEDAAAKLSIESLVCAMIGTCVVGCCCWQCNWAHCLQKFYFLYKKLNQILWKTNLV